jgi:transposase-like protein
MPKTRHPADYTNRRRWTADEAREALAAHAVSGLSMAAFAIREGLDVQRLLRWRRALGGGKDVTTATPAFVELRPRAPEPVEIVLRSGRVLRVSETIDIAALVRLVAALEGTPSC